MKAVLNEADDDELATARFVEPGARLRLGALPSFVESAIWRGTELVAPISTVLASGFALLDQELPGGGWPCQALTEVLQAQSSVLEWRLLGSAMRQVVSQGRDVVLVGSPQSPHLPGLQHIGIDERRLVWIQAQTLAERLWATEQLLKANAVGLLVAWLPQARPEQIRRLQICAQTCSGPVFLCRPAAAKNEPSAAPLRLGVQCELNWQLQVRILKRKGPVHEGVVRLESMPGGLESIITPRLRSPSAMVAARRLRESIAPQENSNALGSSASRRAAQRRVGAH